MYELFKKYSKSITKRGITVELYDNSKQMDDTKRIITFHVNDVDVTLIFVTSNKGITVKSRHDTVAEGQVINLLNQAIKKEQTYDDIDVEKISDAAMFNIIKGYFVNDVTNKNHKIIFKHLIQVLPCIKLHCVSCGRKLLYPSDNFMSCEHKMCKYKLDELTTGNEVTEMYQNKKNILEMLLVTAVAAIKSSRKENIFEPFPPRFLDNSDQFIQRGELSALNDVVLRKNFGIISVLLSKLNVAIIMSKIKKATSDQELSDVLGADLYYLVRFIVKSNKTDLKTVKLFDTIEDKDIKQFSVVHPHTQEEKFKTHTKGKTSFLFHGSSFENWYSILRNGIKIMSGTKLMVNAAAYGTGVYLSDSFAFSCDYSARGSYKDIIVAVFEINGDKRQYKQRTNIYVINNGDDLILRYLLLLPRNNYKQHNDVVSKQFGVKMEIEKQQSKNRFSQRAVARIIKELKDLRNKEKVDIEGLGIRIDVSDDNLSLWSVYFSNFGECGLQTDMDHCNIKEIKLEVAFPENYPLYPPFLRIVRPIFCYQTGRITSGGSICVDTLTLEAWSAATRMESLLLMIKTLLVEGNGRIDPARVGQEYSLEKARASFKRVASAHGWRI